MSEGKEFVFRVICLSVPAGVQVFVLSLVLGLTLQYNANSLFDPVTFRNPGQAYDLVSYALFFGFAIYFWYVIYKSLAKISAIEASRSPQG